MWKSHMFNRQRETGADFYENVHCFEKRVVDEQGENGSAEHQRDRANKARLPMIGGIDEPVSFVRPTASAPPQMRPTTVVVKSPTVTGRLGVRLKKPATNMKRRTTRTFASRPSGTARCPSTSSGTYWVELLSGLMLNGNVETRSPAMGVPKLDATPGCEHDHHRSEIGWPVGVSLQRHFPNNQNATASH